VILRCNSDGDLYTMPASTAAAPPHALLAASSTLWHQRLGHPAPATLERLNKLHAVPCNKVDRSLCHSCQIGKHTRLPFSSSQSITHAPFELVHCDVWTSPINSLSGFSYYLVCLDDYSHYCWAFPLRRKSEVHQHLVELAALAKTQFSSPIKCLQADNGTEFINTATIKFFTAQGTHLRYSCPYTSSQNGKAERIIRTLNNSIRTMLLHASLPPTYWAEGLLTACYLHNRRPSSSIQHDIPFTRLHNQPPTYNHLRVFGCLCYPNMQATSKHKLAPRSTACVFLGYPPSHKGYCCLDLSTRRIIISRHVIFDETTFPFAATSDASPPASYDLFLDDDMVSVPCSTVVAGGTSSSTPVVTPSSSDVEQPPPDVATSHGSSVVPFPRVYVRRPRHEPSGAAAAPAAPPDAQAPAASPAPPPPPLPPRITRTMTGAIPRVSYEGLAATTSPSPSPIPTNYRSALTDARWRAAMMDEYQALVDNNTWQLVPRPPDANIVTGKWIFRHKFHADGSLARHKARWVVRGFSQREGVDYDETFSPVVKPATIRSVLSIAASRAWPIHQLDVKNAFLHGHLEETVYCQQPPGFVDPGAPDHVCRLQKSLYGLKQAPRAWYQRFATFIRQLGFVASTSDTSLFIFREGTSLAYLLLYVDDIVLTASSSALLQRIMTRLSSEFAMTDLGDLHHFLGIAVTRSSDGLFLSQRQYAVELLQRAGMAECHPTPTPVDTHAKLSATDGVPLSAKDASEYRSLAGALQYLTLTRPDLAYAVQQVCLFMHAPREPHRALIKRILRFVQGTLSSGLHIGTSSVNTLTAYSDADWAGCPDSRRSTSGFCVYLGDNLVSWSSKRQTTVSRSSAEAEYRAVAHVVAECCWLRQLLQELHIQLPSATVVFCDNVSAVYMTANPVHHKRTKHIEIDIHFVREKVALGEIRVLHVPSSHQFADIMTKGLPTALFREFQSSLCVREPPASTAGGC
jgi:transposase InsO family protein